MEALIVKEKVRSVTLQEAAIGRPDVIMVDTEGFDAEIVRMGLEADWLPAVIQYEHKHLTLDDRLDLSKMLSRSGYYLWADHADVWGLRCDNSQTDLHRTNWREGFDECPTGRKG